MASSSTLVLLETSIALLINVIGAGAFLFHASRFWADPTLQSISGAGAGDPIVWALDALPIFAFFLFANALLGLGSLIVRWKRGTWPVNRWYLAVLPIWGVALWIDNSHHWIV